MAVTPPAWICIALKNIDQIRSEHEHDGVRLITGDADVVAEHEAAGGGDDAADPDVPGDLALELAAVGAGLGDGETPGHCVSVR